MLGTEANGALGSAQLDLPFLYTPPWHGLLDHHVRLHKLHQASPA